MKLWLTGMLCGIVGGCRQNVCQAGNAQEYRVGPFGQADLAHRGFVWGRSAISKALGPCSPMCSVDTCLS